jgi:hypothetical protein
VSSTWQKFHKSYKSLFYPTQSHCTCTNKPHNVVEKDKERERNLGNPPSLWSFLAPPRSIYASILPDVAMRILAQYQGAQMSNAPILLKNREIIYAALTKRKDFFR